MADLELMRIVEAILIAADAPVSLDRMASIISGYGRTDIRDAVNQLNARYTENGHACEVNEVGGGWQLYCRADYAKWVKELHRGRIPTRLSQAALETLAIIAYKQPIVRPEIEGIRGVDSSGVLATLLKRNLVSIVGRAPGMGRALMYGTTREFLRYFGLNSVTDLPRLEEFAEVLGLKPEELALAVEGAEAMARTYAEENGVEAGDSDEPEVETAVGAVEPDVLPSRGTSDSDIIKTIDET